MEEKTDTSSGVKTLLVLAGVFGAAFLLTRLRGKDEEDDELAPTANEIGGETRKDETSLADGR